MSVYPRGLRTRRKFSRALAQATNPPRLQPLESRILFSFGVTTSTNSYTVDVGANLVFAVNRTTALGGSIGDLQSMTYNGTQLEASFSATSRYSHYESGLSSTTTVTATTDPNGNWIVIACNDLSGVGVIQYYIAEKGVNDIFMATYAPGPDSPSPGEMRFITYTNHSVLTNAPAASNLTGNTGAIESSDVLGFADGTTASKYYGEYEAINTQTYGLSGGGYGVYMNIGNRETSSGGPFFKDIDYQTTSSQSTELYTYTFSGHSQTENFRPGLHGPYALQFTTGPMPPAPNYSFIDGLPITGLVTAAGRGTLTGTASGVPSGHQVTVALSNAADQYWGTPAASGAYLISGIIPGTYTETLYQDELAVGTRSVTITAGITTAANIVDTYYIPPEIFSIGTFDGTPIGFLNSANFPNMHPSDSRMAPWANAAGLTNYTIGTSTPSSWPMAEWKEISTTSTPIDVDNRITFTLTAAQAAVANTLRIALTRAGDGGRPIISVNGGSYSSAPASSTQPTARGVTLGNWRGNNVLYTYGISTSALHSGTNTIDIAVASGSSDTDPWLGPWMIYDAIDLVTTASVNAPTVSTISINSPTFNFAPNAQANFTATAKDSSGNVIPANFNWTITGSAGSTIDNTGLFIASAAAGTFGITAADANGSASATNNGYTISATTNNAPTIATPAAATPNPTTGLTANVSVLGADDGGEANLTYMWTTSAVPTGASPASFSINGTNAAKNAVATFSQVGSYTLLATVRDAGGYIATSSIAVTVNQTFTSIMVSPASAGLNQNSSQQFTATAEDQFGDPLASQPAFTWSMVSGPGSIAATGLYSETTTLGTAVIKATSGAISSTAGITITNGTPTIATAASASPNPATGLTTSLSVLGADDLPESNLTYSWTATSIPVGAGVPTYSLNGTNVAKNTTATFFAAGSYTFLVTVKDSGGLTNTSSIVVTVNQTLSSIAVTPSSVILALNAPQQYTATGSDQFGAIMGTQPTFTWSVGPGSGSISTTGLYTAPGAPGTATIKATNGIVSGSTGETTTNTAPTIATAASATPSPATGTTTNLSVLGADDGSEGNLTYSWTATVVPSGASQPTYSLNGTNAAKNSTATFSKLGSYTFQVTVRDIGGLTVTSSVTVIVTQTPTSLQISPIAFTLHNGDTQQFTASVFDQFNTAMSAAVTWSLDPGSAGSINATGLFTAPAANPGSATIRATAGSATNTVAEFTNLSVIAGPGSPGGDTVRLVHDSVAPNQVDVFLNNFTSTPSFTFNLPAVPSLTLTDPVASTAYILDFSNGSPLPAGATTLTATGSPNTIILVGPSPSAAFNISPTSISRGTSSVNYSGIQMLEFQEGLYQTTADLNGLNIDVDFNATFNLAQAQELGNVGIFDLGSVVVPAAATSGSRVLIQATGLSFDTGAMFNLNNNDLRVANTPVSSVYSAIVAGQLFSGSANSSNGLNALGSLDGATYRMFHPSFQFDSISVQSSDALVKYTYRGDAYLQGTVSVSDYSALDGSFLLGATPSWGNGDYNNDGTLDYRDYQAIDYAFTHQGAPLADIVAPAPLAAAAPLAGPAASAAPVYAALAVVSLSDGASALMTAALPETTADAAARSAGNVPHRPLFSVLPFTPKNWWLSSLSDIAGPTDPLSEATFFQA